MIQLDMECSFVILNLHKLRTIVVLLFHKNAFQKCRLYNTLRKCLAAIVATSASASPF